MTSHSERTTPDSESYRSVGVDLIAQERLRQIEAEGWTSDHDAEHEGDLAEAAACYATRYHSPGVLKGDLVPVGWPWAPHWWKPTPDDRVRELVKAGALIAAEIDRLTTSHHAPGVCCDDSGMIADPSGEGVIPCPGPPSDSGESRAEVEPDV